MFPLNTKILVVDDMGMFRTMVKQSLGELGYKTYKEATDGEAGWKAIVDARTEKAPFGLIMSDWSMPKMKGIELLKKVRAEAWGRNLPFVMLTGEAEKSFIIEAVENKVTQYIIKPFTINDLKTKLKLAYEKFKANDDGIKVVD